MSSAKRILQEKQDSSRGLLQAPLSPTSISGGDFGGFHRIHPPSFHSRVPSRGASSHSKKGNQTLLLLIWFGAGVVFTSLGFLFLELSRDFFIDHSPSGSHQHHQHYSHLKPSTRILNDGGERVPTGKCTTPICMQAAARLLARIDATRNPCSDFYQYSCGSFLQRNEIPDDSFMKSTLQEMQESILVDIKKLIDQPLRVGDSIAIRKAKQLYTSCMDQSYRTSHYSDYKFLPIFNVLKANEFGNWPILMGNAWDPEEFDLDRLMGKLFAHQVQNIFELYVTPDDTVDNPTYILQFYKGEPAMARNFFLNTTNPDYIKYVRVYKRILIESVLILSHGKQGSPTVNSDVEEMLNFESKLAKLSQESRCQFDSFDFEPDDETTIEEEYGRTTLADVQEKVPEINWIQIIQNIYTNLGISKTASGDSAVYFHCPEYFPGLVKLIQESDKRVVTNYLIWRFVFRYMPFLGNKFSSIWSEFMKDVPDVNEEKLYLSRWKQCSAIVNDGFGLSISHLYVKHKYRESTEDKVRNMIHYLKQSFSIIILEQSWLDDDFKRELIEKLMNMRYKIGYPQHIMDSHSLDREYEGLEFDEEQPFLGNILKLRRYEVFKEIRKVDHEVDKEKDWLIQPLVANAFHNPGLNEIVIPLGLLREPMFSIDFPMYINFANLGIVIAHELTHGFDQVGRHYDKDGNFSMSWWPENVLQGFKKQAICYIDHYARFQMPIGANVDGNETLGENICDTAALRQAFNAYKLWVQDNGEEEGLPGVDLSIPQIFYASYGQIWCEVLSKEGYETYLRDTHAPGEFRTIGVAQNNRDFAEIFNCPVGAPMNPKEKCSLWS